MAREAARLLLSTFILGINKKTIPIILVQGDEQSEGDRQSPHHSSLRIYQKRRDFYGINS